MLHHDLLEEKRHQQKKGGSDSHIKLCVYCPHLSKGKEECAKDNVLYFYPPRTPTHDQVNLVGFCMAVTSLSERLGSTSCVDLIGRKGKNLFLQPLYDSLYLVVEMDTILKKEAIRPLLYTAMQAFLMLLGYGAFSFLTNDKTTGDERASLQETESSPSSSSQYAHEASDGNSVFPSPSSGTREAAFPSDSPEITHFLNALASYITLSVTALHVYPYSHCFCAQCRRNLVACAWDQLPCTKCLFKYPIESQDQSFTFELWCTKAVEIAFISEWPFEKTVTEAFSQSKLSSYQSVPLSAPDSTKDEVQTSDAALVKHLCRTYGFCIYKVSQTRLLATNLSREMIVPLTLLLLIDPSRNQFPCFLDEGKAEFFCIGDRHDDVLVLFLVKRDIMHAKLAAGSIKRAAQKAALDIAASEHLFY